MHFSKFVLLSAAFALVFISLSCQRSDDGSWDGAEVSSVEAELAQPGRWAIPASTIAIGDQQDVTYDSACPWDGGIHCAPWLKPGTVMLRDALYGYFPQIASIGGYNCRAVRGLPNVLSQHGTGRALDLYITTIDNEADNDAGDPIGHWLIENAEALGIQNIIWDWTSWNVSRSSREAAYGGSVSHNNHLHIEITEEAGDLETAWYTNPFGPAPCAVIPPTQTIVSEDGPCFSAFGPAQYWRTEAAGHDGSLRWTNAFDKTDPSNWARWNLVFETAGEYEVEVYIDPTWGVYSATRYGIMAAGQEHVEIINQSTADGWTSLGTYRFEAGRNQHVDVYDNYPTPGDDQHIVSDAIRLTPGALEVCEALPSEGGIIEETSPCFARWGLPEYWRNEAAGHDGSLYWTNAYDHDTPGNWAHWDIIVGEAGSYEVSVYLEAAYSVYPEARYGVRASGADQTLIVDQSAASGWVPIGVFDFAVGGDQHLELYDNYTGTIPSDQHLAFDAIRLARAGGHCGDGTCGTDETCASCVADCGACDPCGDGTCAATEDCASCEADCGACDPCGDGVCGSDETCTSCEADCGACEGCGDGVCGSDETCTSCAVDCGVCEGCGDGQCAADESCESCSVDCGACEGCGDGVCADGESCSTCEVDCGLCGGCGDGVCEGYESCEVCSADCTCDLNACGDGVCEAESCSTCPADCGACEGEQPVGSAEVNDDGCGCSQMSRPPGAWALVLAFVGLLFLRRRR